MEKKSHTIAEVVALGMVAKWIEKTGTSWLWSGAQLVGVHDSKHDEVATVQYELRTWVKSHEAVRLTCYIRKVLQAHVVRPQYVADRVEVVGPSMTEDRPMVVRYVESPVPVPFIVENAQ